MPRHDSARRPTLAALVAGSGPGPVARGVAVLAVCTFRRRAGDAVTLATYDCAA
ncbi:hypothetical protein [Haloglomus litoreum]|uniref:hypothetical protein n=1 Tax=Haloglomus litoreum TaxID=3034026 RepID=UPI0023E77509|nr:hypothetical protein [Haloglomus sp. DT116]